MHVLSQFRHCILFHVMSSREWVTRQMALHRHDDSASPLDSACSRAWKADPRRFTGARWRYNPSSGIVVKNQWNHESVERNEKLMKFNGSSWNCGSVIIVGIWLRPLVTIFEAEIIQTIGSRKKNLSELWYTRIIYICKKSINNLNLFKGRTKKNLSELW